MLSPEFLSLKINLEVAEKSLASEELVVKYQMDLDKFCDVNFDELKSYVSWQRFYAFLVSIIISIRKEEKLEDLPDITKVVVP